MKTPEHIEWLKQIKDHTHFTPKEIIGAYLARYPEAYKFTLGFEGGYVDDPDDPGGCTNMGITIGTLTAWRDDPTTDCADVMNLSPVEAGMIYALNYWAPVWGNRLPVGLNTQVWDWGVNSGPGTAIKHLQRLAASPDDGVMGPNTLAAVDDWVARVGMDVALRNYHYDRQCYYESLSTFSKYGNGWTRRNDECLALSLDLVR